ncbi:MAG: hypothetical protein WB775_02655 [Burkholderiaceae bacterium]
MTDLALTYLLRKTESGVNAIKVRDRAMGQKHRMLLILVDGAKPVGALVKSLANPDEARQVLGELLDSGYVEIVNAPPPPPPQAPASAPAAAAVQVSGALSEAALPESIRRATRLLENLLGPGSEPLCLQLEKCKSIDQFTARILEIRRVVAGMRSETKAAEFVAAALKA